MKTDLGEMRVMDAHAHFFSHHFLLAHSPGNAADPIRSRIWSANAGAGRRREIQAISIRMSCPWIFTG